MQTPQGSSDWAVQTHLHFAVPTGAKPVGFLREESGGGRGCTCRGFGSARVRRGTRHAVVCPTSMWEQSETRKLSRLGFNQGGREHTARLPRDQSSAAWLCLEGRDTAAPPQLTSLQAGASVQEHLLSLALHRG